MILTTHALAGAVIGKNINNPVLVVAISLAVHFLMDTLRHGEYFDSRIARIKDTWWKIAIDISIGFSIIFLFIILKSPDTKTIMNMAIGIFTSMLPDGLTLLDWKFPGNKILDKIKDFHSWAHRYNRFPKFSPERQWNLRNAANDIIISAIAVLLLFLA